MALPRQPVPRSRSRSEVSQRHRTSSRVRPTRRTARPTHSQSSGQCNSEANKEAARETRGPTAGALAEQAAAAHLLQHDYRICERNFRCRLGEIDIIAVAPDGTLVFVEVRHRSRTNFGSGADSVTAQKRRRLILAAARYLAVRNVSGLCRTRFDVISMRGSVDAPTIEWIEGAFMVEQNSCM